MKSKLPFLLTLSFCLLLNVHSTFAQGTAFTYQGQLSIGGSPANGSYDFQFIVYDNISGGIQQGPILTNAATTVTNGLFNAVLDFGNVFPGANRWLDVSVRTNGGAAFTAITPRQPLTPAPYAITAASVQAGAITANMLASGSITTDKIAAGAVKGYQIDDGGAAAYGSFQESVQSAGGDATLGFTDIFQVTPTNGQPAGFTLAINGATFGSVAGFSGSEGISQPYFYVVETLVSGTAVNPDSEIGLAARLTFTRNGRSTTFAGIVTACTLSASTPTGLLYTVRIESPLAYLALTTDYHIYQNLTIPAVASSVYLNIATNTITQSLTATYSAHEFTVQYRETDFNFVSRLLEHEGIFYFFNHGANPPALVFGDSASAYLTAPNSPFPYFGNTASNLPAGAEYIRAFQKAVHQSTLRSVADTYDFTAPAASLTAINTGAEGAGEFYEFGAPVTTLAYDQQLALARQDRHNLERALISGASAAPDLRAGYTFALSDQTGAGLGGNYLVTSIHHAGFVRITNGISTVFYGNQFQVIPASLNYRPALATPKPRAQAENAVVTGPAGQTIYVDKYGRVKVQFFWDRLGKNDQNSSAWIRVATPMAGANHGAIFIPQVGDEVLVSFLEGDPDRPVIIGSLYNGTDMPPYALPGSQHVTAIQSIGSDGQINEIKFDDTAGSQTFNLNAAKDLAIHANHQITMNGPVSFNGGTVFTNMLAGQGIVGSSSTAETNINITFPKAFITVPHVLVSPSADPNWNVPDTFVASVRSVSTTNCLVNVLRVDASTGWSQVLRVNWLAWE